MTLAGGTLVLALASCAGRGPRTGARQPASSQEATSEGAASALLAEALDEALAGRTDWESLRIESECASDEGYRSLTVHGNGVGIWSEERQFRLVRRQVADLLRAFRRARFTRLRDTYGGSRPNAVLKVVCSVSLALGGASKRVTQLERGQQSPELKRLAREIFALCRGAARGGVTAENLSAGLGKLAAGELAPETLRVLLHRKPEAGTASAEEGFLLRLDGLGAVTQAYTSPEGYGDPMVLKLSTEDVAELARRLGESDPDSLPANVYAESYTDLTMRVLGRERSIQARQFARLEPATLGTRQEAFDRAVEILHALHLRVLREGAPAPEEPESER